MKNLFSWAKIDNPLLQEWTECNLSIKANCSVNLRLLIKLTRHFPCLEIVGSDFKVAEHIHFTLTSLQVMNAQHLCESRLSKIRHTQATSQDNNFNEWGWEDGRKDYLNRRWVWGRDCLADKSRASVPGMPTAFYIWNQKWKRTIGQIFCEHNATEQWRREIRGTLCRVL